MDTLALPRPACAACLPDGRPRCCSFPGIPVSTKVFCLIILVGLYGHWVLGYRLRGYPLIADLVDFAGLFFLGVVLQDPTRLLGVTFQALWLRGTFGTARHAISTTAAFALSFGAAIFVTMGPVWRPDHAIGLGTIPNLLSVGAIGYLGSLARRPSKTSSRSKRECFRSLVQNSSDVIMVV